MGPNFLGQLTSKDGTPLGPKRYKEIVKECWYISDNLNTSYTEVLDLAYQDRVYLTEYINEKKKQTSDYIEGIRAKRNNKSK